MIWFRRLSHLSALAGIVLIVSSFVRNFTLTELFGSWHDKICEKEAVIQDECNGDLAKELISDYCLYGIVLNEYKESMEEWHTRLFYQVLLGLALFLPLSIEFPGKKGVDAN